MRVELLQGAEADLLEAYVWLDERSEGLGDRFYMALDFALERLRRHPEMASVYRGVYQRLILRPFRLGVFYAIQGERVIVGAILDLRQDPEAIARRLFQ